MNLLIVAVLGVVAIVAVNALAPRIGVASPLLLVLLGVIVSYLRVTGTVEIPSEVILGGVLPPLLYSAAVSMPTMEFRRDFRIISGLSVVLVFASAIAIGLLVNRLLPGIGLPLAIALGAIISPTDAVATGIVRKAGVSSRIVTVLEGESLLNDASALVLLRSAVAAVGVTIVWRHVMVDFVYAVVVAVAIGFAVGKLNLVVRSRLRQATSSVAVSLVVPFVAFLPAEHLGASGLVAAVTAGLVTGHGSPKYLRPEDRITERAVWRTLELLLESFIFLTMGLEMHTVIDQVRAEHGSVGGAVAIAALAFVMIIAVRSVFVAWSLWLLRRRERRSGSTRTRIESAQDRMSELGTRPPPVRPGSSPEEQAARVEQRTEQFQTRVSRALADLDYLADQRLGWREGVILVWAGMRGAVTLAAAQSLDRDIPQRDILVLIAFTVAAGTLLIQGGTLGWLARRLGLAHHGHVDEDTPTALRADLVDAASARLDDPELRRPDGEPFSTETLDAARAVLDGIGRDGPWAETPAQRAERRALRIQLLNAQRDELLRIRDLGTYPFGVLEQALNQIDADQVGLELREKD